MSTSSQDEHATETDDAARDDKPAKRLLGLRVAALFELALFMALAFGFDHVVLDDTRFWDIHPHPFWLAVTMLSVQYGTNEGLLATVVATLMLFSGDYPRQDMGQDFFDYLFELSRLPLLWFVTSVALGELTNRHLRERATLSHSLARETKRASDLADAYQRAKTARDRLEEHVASQVGSAVSALALAGSMDVRHAGHALIGAVDLVKRTVAPERFSLYFLVGNSLQVGLQEGWRGVDDPPETVNGDDPLFRRIVAGKQMAAATRPQDEPLLDGHGLVAAPLVDPIDGRVLGMLKIEALPFADLTFFTLEMIQAVAGWIGAALSQAERHVTLAANSMVTGDGFIFSDAFYRKQRAFLESLSRRTGVPVSLITIRVPSSLPGQAGATHRSREISRIVEEALRTTDLAFESRGGDYTIVLPAADQEGAEIVASRLKPELVKALGMADDAERITLDIQVLGREADKAAIGEVEAGPHA